MITSWYVNQLIPIFRGASLMPKKASSHVYLTMQKMVAKPHEEEVGLSVSCFQTI